MREVKSLQELLLLIDQSPEPGKIKVWVYDDNEWLTLAQFRQQFPVVAKKEKEKPLAPAVPSSTTHTGYFAKPRKNLAALWTQRLIILAVLAAGVLLIVKFTTVNWVDDGPYQAAAIRPANVPVMDIDSLIYEIEETRGQAVDKGTRNNLRLRNTWPEKIALTLDADKQSSSAGNRFTNFDLTIDNSTGFKLDQAVVKISRWKNKKLTGTDTLHFRSVGFNEITKRHLDQTIQADSISVSFESLKAKAFNFCYAASTKNSPGSYNDRWFCRE